MGIADYFANGGDGMTFFKGSPTHQTGKMLRQAIIEYMENLQSSKLSIVSKLDDRAIIRKNGE